MKIFRPTLIAVVGLVAVGFFSVAANAQSTTTAPGVIEGRVLSAGRDEYLENARVSIEGAALETFTDANGNYRLANVPPGNVRVKVFYTGLAVQIVEVAVGPGQSVARDFSLAPLAAPADGRDADTVKLSKFVVAASRDMDAAALAINEQRFAANIKNVVSTEEFGNTAESNPGEFLKYLPGISITYNAGSAREVSINGVPTGNVPVTIDGFSVASTGSGATGRPPALDFLSINNASRIEVSYSPTPESQGMALAGSVNIVPRSSFGRSRPIFNYSVYLTMRDNARDFQRTPGPRAETTRKVHPGFDVSWIVPVNQRFGFTFSAGSSTTYGSNKSMSATWRGVSAATNGPAGTFPDTTVDRPYLTQYAVTDSATDLERRAFGVTLDYKLAEHDRLTFSYQWSSFSSNIMNRILTFSVTRVAPGNFGPTFTHGFAGAGTLQIQSDAGLDRLNRTYMPSLVWRHEGPVWKAEAGAALSYATNHIRGVDKGFFNLSSAQRTGVTVSFDDIFYLRPRSVTVTDGITGAPVDPYNLGSYALTSATGQVRNPTDFQPSAYANVRRDFYGRVPLTLKTGLDFRQLERGIRNHSSPFSYVGRDGRASTTPVGGDDSAAPFVDASFSQRIPPFGFPRTQWLGAEVIYDYYRANPGQFVLDENSDYRTVVTSSKFARETISAAYLRGDTQFFNHRLKLTGGVRAEQTNELGLGPLTDTTRNIQRDARGQPILGANGRPLAITSVPLEVAKLTILERGARVDKEYLRFFPSLNASFNVRENLIARAAYYYSIGRPDLDQYTGGLTLPDTANPPSATNRIIVNNAGLKPWSAKSTTVRLEYYFAGVGQVSVGAFRRDFKNFFGGTTFRPTADFLAPYGLDPNVYGNFDAATQENIPGTVRTQGIDLSYKQALTFLPHWARGVQVFANASALRALGPTLANFTGFNLIPRGASYGWSLTREKFNVRMNWNYRGRQRNAQVNGVGIEPGTFNYTSSRLSIDLLGEYYFRKNVAVFANLRNLHDAPIDAETVGPHTPPESQFRTRGQIGALWTFGLKGTF